MPTPPPPVSPPPKGKKLLDQVTDAIRVKHYSSRTEKTYKDWIKRYTLRVFHGKRHPREMGAYIMPTVTQIALSPLQKNAICDHATYNSQMAV